jgi:hypothetical protein
MRVRHAQKLVLLGRRVDFETVAALLGLDDNENVWFAALLGVLIADYPNNPATVSMILPDSTISNCLAHLLDSTQKRT